MPGPKYLKENLIFLTKESNSSYFKLTKNQPDSIFVDLERGVWGVVQPHYHTREPKRDLKIGAGCRDYGYVGACVSGVVGVFDKTNFDHLKILVTVVSNVIREESRGPFGID